MTVHNGHIIICGAGPIGMTLALDLASKGVRSTLIERTDGSVDTPKLGLVSIRTMEIFRRLGLTDNVRNTVFRRDFGLSMVYCTSISGHYLGKIPYPSLADEPFVPESPETKWRCSQIFLNPMLLKEVKSNPLIDLRLLTSVEGFADRGTHVEVDIVGSGGNAQKLEGAYLVGCDGAGSSIRRRLEIDMTGNQELDYSVAIFFRSKALGGDHKMGQAERYFFLSEEGWWGNISAMDGYELWRLTVPGTKDTVPEIISSAEQWVRRALGTGDMPFEIISTLPWRRTQLTADSYHKGRVILAGDSVHTMSPTGGLGMNTGMGDVNNLAWKLAALVAGWGGSKLIESYGIERRPIAIRNSNASTHNYNQLKSVQDCAKILDPTQEGDAVRERVGREITAATETEWEMLGIHLGYRYDNSPVIISDGTQGDEDHPRWFKPSARPGHRAPHAWINGRPRYGLSTLDLFGNGFTLLQLGSNPPDASELSKAARDRNAPLRIIALESEEIESLYETQLVLVRPDGHVAWRGEKVPDDCAGLIARVTGH